MNSLANKYSNTEAAKDILSNEGFVPATPLLISADMLTGGSCFVWEIDTLLEELDDLDCLPEASNRDRLLASIALLLNPGFLWDAQGFMCVAQSITGKLAVPELWEPLSPAAIAYTVKEIESLYSKYKGLNNLDALYAEEPKIYMAGCCANSGLAKLPTNLMSICSNQFNRMYSLPNSLEDELANSVQLRKHEEVDAYLKCMHNLRSKFMSKLK